MPDKPTHLHGLVGSYEVLVHVFLHSRRLIVTAKCLWSLCVLQISDKASLARNGTANPGRMGRKPNSSTTGTNSGADAIIFAGNLQGGLSNKYAGDPNLKEPLDARCSRHGNKM